MVPRDPIVKLVVDENIAAATDAFGELGEIALRPGRAIARADVAAADALIVRSVTRVDASLLAGSPIRFVGSATIGIDHVDTAWLEQAGIAFANAPGCNAVAVCDWVVAALAELAVRDRHAFRRGSVGVVGAGNVGSRVARRLGDLGYAVRVCDPPRAEVEGSAGFVSLAEALACDVVTLHVPLTDSGPCPTHGMIDAAAIARIPPHGVLLNAARGGVIDEDALAARIDGGPPLAVALDCWAGEPEFDGDLLARVDIGTPHIAGYSLEGRLRGTAMVAAAVTRHFGLHSGWDWRDALPPPPVIEIDEDVIGAIRRACPVLEDDSRMRSLLREPEDRRGAGFDRLRRDYPARREFGAFTLHGMIPPAAIAAGFGVSVQS